MKLSQSQQTSEFKTNLDESKSKAFGISDVSMIINILRNHMYGNKIQTLTQEYMSNARDAHREIGQTRKIEVTFPTVLEPNFVVRDYGPGITDERMSTVFVLYGASTKRDSNQQTGGFGIGAKSGWAYADSFTITTYIDGVKRVYVAHISSNGSNKNGCIDLITESPTAEDNGTSITIAVRKGDEEAFCEAIVRGTMFWDEAEYPDFISVPDDVPLAKAREIGKQRFMGTNVSGLNASDYTNISGIHIVMDGIPYPYPNINIHEPLAQLRNLVECQSFNIFIPNGLLQAAASRESIDDSDFTKKGLTEVLTAAVTDFKEAKKRWEDTIVDIPTMIEAREYMGGFALSSSKSVDLVTLKSGNLELQTDLMEGGKHVSRYFTTKVMTSKSRNNRQGSFDLDAEHRYYMTRSGNVKVMDIMDWIDGHATIKNISLVTIVAQTAKYDKQGNWVAFRRNNDMIPSLVESLERLGFKSLESEFPNVYKRMAAGPKLPRIVGSVYKLTDRDENLISMSSLEGANKKGKWVYFNFSKNDFDYYSRHSFAMHLVDLGEIEFAFRVTDSKLKTVQKDSRFISSTDFLKNWKPKRETILRMLISGSMNGDKDAKYRSSQVFNIKENMKDKKHPLYRICNGLASLKELKNTHNLREIPKNKHFRDAVDEMVKLNKFFDEHLPLLDQGLKKSSHIADYIDWSLEKADKNDTLSDIAKKLQR